MTQWVQVLQWSLEFMIHQNLEHNIILDNKTAFPLFTTGKYHSGDKMTMIMMMMKCFYGMVDRKKAFTSYFQPVPLSEIITISHLRHDVSRI